MRIRAALASSDPPDERRERLSRRLDSRPAIAGQNLRLANPRDPLAGDFCGTPALRAIRLLA